MEIRGFRGWRYATAGGDVGPMLAPPYDVLTAEDKRALLARCEENIVAVDLPCVPPSRAGPEEAYRGAAALLERWKASGILSQDARPCLYPYEQIFRRGMRTYTRRALLCGVRATPLGQDVLPHERTFAGPKADRLKLTEHTRMQLSPVFGFYDDPGGRVVDAVFSGLCCPALFGKLGDVDEKLWKVDDPGVIAHVAGLLRDAPVFIADGHHRYATALAYRDSAVATGRATEDTGFVLFALVAKDDPGLLVLPTHRIISGLADGFSPARLADAAGDFKWRKVDASAGELEDAERFLAPFGPGAMAIVGLGGREIMVGTLRGADAMRRAAPDECEVWRSLDVAVLHTLIVDKALAPWRTDATGVEYTPDAAAVVSACRAGRAQLGVCLQAPPVSAIQRIALAGASMPHKSTYFYPKLATGMVLKPL